MTSSTMRIAPAENELLNGEMAASKRDYDTAIVYLDRAVQYQDAQACNGLADLDPPTP